ncbi:MAG TPA: putative lipid II flippase FtsW [Verrucomicrobiae bacterium]|jgi:cell division protein FtsW|nr:putative lipid II flippase FtsW [Verrucomicrobiae bacterium]
MPRRSFVGAPPDTLLFASVATLVAIGLVMIFSASSALAYVDSHDPAYFVKRQFVWLAVGLLCAYGAYRMDYRKLKQWAPYLLLAAIVLLSVVLIHHVGIVVGGARRWLGAGPLTMQPSEFAKLALAVYLAAMLSTRGDRIGSLVKGLAPLCVPPLLMALLIFKEPDMGTASLLVMTAFVMYFSAGARIAHLLGVIAVTLPPAALAVLASSYLRARIMVFLDPWKDRQNHGFQVVQSMLALGSGGLFGVGLGASRAKFFYLPEQYTDFIFSVLGEELGLFGALVVITAFVVLAYRAIRIAIAAPDSFGFFLVVGCTATIVIQAFVNIGVVTSSWPLTGVPLPFISFGGSSLIVNLVAVALILNVGRYRRVDA